MRSLMAYLIILLLFFFSWASANFTLSAFNDGSCTFLGDATIKADSIDLTMNKYNQNITSSQGKVYYKEPFRFKNATTAASFSTVIDFLIETENSCPGDGMTFFVQADPPKSFLWANGSSLGISGTAQNPFLAVEFDTFLNRDSTDASITDCPFGCFTTSSFHVGIDLNTMVSVNHTCYEMLTIGNQTAWVDYDAQTQLLELRITQQSNSRPSAAIVSAHVDLFTLFKNNDSLYVGLSAATGAAAELHTIFSWSFNIAQLQIPLSAPAPLPPPNPAPSPPPQYNLAVSPPSSKNTRRPTLIIVFAITIPACALIACLVCIRGAQIRNRKKHDNVPQMPEINIPLSRYSYADLSLATKRFSKTEILGKGGYGSVYKGMLPSDGSMVAVKVMAVEGLQQFLAELSVIGRLKHKNLVGLRGWCYDQEKLILVYDYMPNGSLDQHLFSTDRLLSWSQRYEIIKGIAEGLLFLHCGWEQRIVHRDIKAANVLLDGKFSARLGDFGLSKLMEDNKTQQTMTQAGTRGYIAPELAYMGKANEKSDIYSFGVLLLEIACGKSVLGSASEIQEYQFLLDWVWQAHAMDDLLGVADPRLNLEYNQEEMRVVLCLGLICSHPDADRRPSMKECCQIINYGAVLPDLPISKPTVSFGNHQSPILFQSSGSKGQSSGYTNSGNSDRSSVPLLHHT